MKTGFILLLVLLSWSIGVSQQLPHFSQYMLNGYLINPAVAGSENYLDIKVGYRNHWTGISGAPESYYVTMHAPLDKLNLNTTPTSFPSREVNGSKVLYRDYIEGNAGKITPHHGVGLTMISDEAGALKRSGFHITYAYHQPLSKTFKMSAGVSLGMAFYKVNEEKLYLSNPDDPAFQTYNHAEPTISVGLLLYSNRFYAGLTAAQLLQDELSGANWSKQDRSYSQYYFTTGYKIALSSKFSVLPSTLIRYLRSVSISADANIKLLYGDKVWLGGSYRNQDAIILMGGANFDNLFQISYAYDMSNTAIGRMSNGSHEIVLGLLLNNAGKIFSPSDFW